MDVIKFRNSYFLACTFKYILLNMFMNILYSVGGRGEFYNPQNITNYSGGTADCF